MYINSIDNNNVNALSQGRQPDKQAKASAAGTRILSVDTDTDGYAEKALSLSSESSSTDIQKVRALLAAGQLDTPDAIRQAAANIATLGI
jgi:hypothetical protein